MTCQRPEGCRKTKAAKLCWRCHLAALNADPGERARRAERMRAVRARNAACPDTEARRVEGIRKAWANPGLRAAQAKKKRADWRDPDTRARMLRPARENSPSARRLPAGLGEADKAFFRKLRRNGFSFQQALAEVWPEPAE